MEWLLLMLHGSRPSAYAIMMVIFLSHLCPELVLRGCPIVLIELLMLYAA